MIITIIPKVATPAMVPIVLFSNSPDSRLSLVDTVAIEIMITKEYAGLT